MDVSSHSGKESIKSIVKSKYKMDVEVKATYATGQEDFYNAAKNGTADLISPPADTPKTPGTRLLEKVVRVG